jgi:DNA-binding CsgD family transcriptional regulator
MQLAFAEEFAQELDEIGDRYALEGALGQLSRRLGFDHFALTLEPRAAETTSPELLLHDYPDEWAKVYTGFELSGRDPVRRACDHTFTGFAWEWIDRLVPLTRGDRQMLAVGQECGIGDGYTVPRHLPGMARGSCSFVVRPGKALPQSSLAIAELTGALALTCALGFTEMRRKPIDAKLSDRQRECLLWVARGKTASETAIILGISAETVVQHLKMARERYEVHCKQALILSALFDGVIGFADVFRLAEIRSP